MKARTPLIILALLGLAASLASATTHYRLMENPAASSFCDVNSTVSCTQAYLSPYGSLLGVPVALFGVLYFAVILALAALGGRRTAAVGARVPSYIFALSIVGTLFVLYLGSASFFVLKAVCLLCATTYLATIAILVVSARASTLPLASVPAAAVADVGVLVSSPIALLVAAIIAVGGVSSMALFPESQVVSGSRTNTPAPVPLTDAQRADVEKWWDLQPKVDVPFSNEGTKVLMVKFSDYQCPSCGISYTAYAPVIDKWTKTGQFRFMLKHYPLEAECNAGAPGGGHAAACEAAAAVQMARRKGDGSAERLEHWLFTHQTPMLSPDQVKQAAKDVAGIQDFQALYADALKEVRADAAQGDTLQVKQTPTFFINGRKLEGAQDARVIDAVIELESKRAK